MKIGILQCDSVMSQFQGQHGDYPEMIASLFYQVAAMFSIEISFETYDVVHGCYPNEIDDCDAYITTGSKASVYNGDAWIAALQAFIIRLRQAEKGLVAICFGHQLVAQAFGGRVEKGEKCGKGWGVGVHTMQLVAERQWMAASRNVCNLLVSHQDQVTELPADAVLIATSHFCPNAMFQLGKSILTIQGHPEFSKSYAEALMGFRRELLGEPLYTVGIESLQKGTDELTIAHWMVNFMVEALPRSDDSCTRSL